jgi:hypothetical protein
MTIEEAEAFVAELVDEVQVRCDLRGPAKKLI